MAALDRGKLVVLFIFGISIVSGVFACWHFYEKGDQAKEFWGTETANLIYHAPKVELLKLHVGDDLPADVIEEIDIEGKTRAVIVRIDVTNARGLIHLRGALIEDASFEWGKPRGNPIPVWDFVLRFKDEDKQAAIAIDLPSKRARLIGRDREIGISPIAKGVRELIKRQDVDRDVKNER